MRAGNDEELQSAPKRVVLDWSLFVNADRQWRDPAHDLRTEESRLQEALAWPQTGYSFPKDVEGLSQLADRVDAFLDGIEAFLPKLDRLIVGFVADVQAHKDHAQVYRSSMEVIRDRAWFHRLYDIYTDGTRILRRECFSTLVSSDDATLLAYATQARRLHRAQNRAKALVLDKTRILKKTHGL